MLYVILKFLKLVICVYLIGVLRKFFALFLLLKMDDVCLYVLPLHILPFFSFIMVVIRDYIYIIILIEIVATELWIVKFTFNQLKVSKSKAYRVVRY